MLFGHFFFLVVGIMAAWRSPENCRPLKQKKEVKERQCHLDMAELFASARAINARLEQPPRGDNALSHEGAKWRPLPRVK